MRTDEVPDEEPGVTPNIDAIAKLVAINGPIARAEEEGQNSRSNLGNYYKRIQDDLHGHRGAAKLVRKLLSMTATARADFMRTFEPLAEHFNLFPSQVENPDRDMVDEIENPGGGRAPSGVSALDAAKSHLSSGTKPDEPAAQPQPDAAGPKAEPEVAATAVKKKGAGAKPATQKPKLSVAGGTDVTDTKH